MSFWSFIGATALIFTLTTESHALFNKAKCYVECTAKACTQSFGKFQNCLRDCPTSTTKNCKVSGMKKWYPNGMPEEQETEGPQKTISFPPKIPEDQPIIILSIDGGGVRGIVAAMLIDAIEKAAGKKTYQIFDVLGGTSAGSIVAGFLDTPDVLNKRQDSMSAAEAVGQAQDMMKTVFSNSLWRKVRTLNIQNKIALAGAKYSGKPMEKDLFRRLGDMKLTSTLKPIVITSWDFTNRRPFLFTTSEAYENPAHNFKVRDAIRASTAAPTFFKPHLMMIDGEEVALTDGGVVMNNPELIVLSEALKLYPNRRYILVSIATGDYKAKQNVSGRGATAGNPFAVLGPLINGAIGGQSDVSQLISRYVPNVEYYRINVNYDSKECNSLDSTSQKTITCLKRNALNRIKDPDFQKMTKRIATVVVDRERSLHEPPQKSFGKKEVKKQQNVGIQGQTEEKRSGRQRRKTVF